MDRISANANALTMASACDCGAAVAAFSAIGLLVDND
jgi:hypothetical protein